jgi:hypothetical protein
LRVSGSLNRIQSAWHWFLGISMAYGYKPLRLIYAAAVLILVGWGVFGYASAHAAMVPSKPAEVSIALPASYPRFSSLMYSVDTFLPIIDFYQEGYWIPNTHRSRSRCHDIRMVPYGHGLGAFDTCRNRFQRSCAKRIAATGRAQDAMAGGLQK